LVEPFDSQHRASAPDIQQASLSAAFVPQKNRSLLDHKHVEATGALRHDELVRLEEPDAAKPSKREQIRHIHSLKWRMFLEEIGNAIAYSGGIHSTSS
jgi:hypothetical protein